MGKHLKGFGPLSISRIALPKKRSNLLGEASKTNTKFKNEPMGKLLDHPAECCQLLHSKSPLPLHHVTKKHMCWLSHLSQDTHTNLR